MISLLLPILYGMYLKITFLAIVIGCLNLHAQESGSVETQIQKGHIQPVSALAWHPSGKYFASGSADHSVILWAAETGKQIRQFGYHTGKVLNLRFSKDGNQLLSSGGDNTVLVVDVLTGKLLEKYTYDNPNAYAMSVSFSSGENYILVGDNRDNLTMINRADGKRTTYKKGFSATVHPLTVSPDEKLKLIIENYKSVSLIQEIDKDTFQLGFDKAYHYSFSPDGKQLAVGSEKLFLTVFDVQTGKEIKTLNFEEQCDGCKIKFDYSGDGKHLVTYDHYNGLTIYKTTNWKPLGQTIKFPISYSTVSFSPSGNYVLLMKDDEFLLFSVNEYKEVLRKKNENFSGSELRISPDDKHILTGGDYFTIESLALPSGKKSFNYRGFSNDDAHRVEQLDYNSWFQSNIVNHLKLKPAVAISQNGLIAQGKLDTVVTLFDLNNGRFQPPLLGHSHQVISLTFNPSGEELATGDASGRIIVWDLTNNRILHDFRAHVSFVLDLAFNSKGTELLSSSWDATIKHWSLENTEQGYPKRIGLIDLENNAVNELLFSPNDLYLITGDATENITYYEADTKKYAFDLIGHASTISGIIFFENSNGQKLLASSSRDGWVKIWDFNSGRLLDKVCSENKTAILSLTYDETNNLLYFGSSDRKVYCYDTEKRHLISSFEAHQAAVCFLSLRKNENELITKSTDGEIKCWKLNGPEPVESYSYFQINGRDWLITRPDGYFDGSAQAMKQINYVSGLNALKVESFFKKYYTPGLYQEILNGWKSDHKDRGLNELLQEIPRFELYFINNRGQETLSVKDSVYNHPKSEVELILHANKKQDEFEEILVYNNGKLIFQETFKEDVIFRGSGQKRRLVVPLAPKENEVSVRITTSSGINPEDQRIRLFYDTLQGKSELFLFTLGINKYENERYNLNYAGNDAEAFAKTIEKGAQELFHTVYNYSLRDKKVTRENVLQTIEEIKRKMGPEDVFVFFYAGHGVMLSGSDQSNDFYLVMSDITNLYGDKTTMDLKGLSARDLLDISKMLPAQKQVFVLDACQSGAALKELAIRGVDREKALAQLARSSGTFFLTASQDVEYANEVGNLKHGIFTYAILELLNGVSEKVQKNETISVYQLKSYVESRVPELTKEYKGSAQYPTGYSFGNDFPIGVVK